MSLLQSINLFGFPDVLPTYQQVWKYVKQQKREVFDDLVHGVRILRLSNQPITKPRPQLYVFMKSLENGNLKLNYYQQVQIELF